MYSSVYLLLGAVVAYCAISCYNGLQSNIAAARRTGLPCVVVPCSPFSIPWQLTCSTWTPIIKTLPKSWWESWIDVMQPDWSYRLLQAPWERLGDTFLVVSPGDIIMWTRSAEAIHQFTARREAFPKPTQSYEILAIFGRNILTTEGPEWKIHRKGVSASFNERNAAQIFAESLEQTQGLIAHWMGGAVEDKNTSGNITTLEHDTMTLALNIIAHVGFGLRFFWAGQKMPDDLSALNKKYASFEAPAGHSMTFVNSLATVLERITLLLIVPKWLLQILPFKSTKSALEAYNNYNHYMEEFLQDKIEAAQFGDDTAEGGMDLMGQLVRAKYGGKGKSEKGKDEPQLSDSDILGDAFIIIVAGHETTANTLHFTLLELANNPAAQRALQADIDRILGRDSDPSTWNYEQSINALTASNIAACMNEALRMVPPVVDIPKWVSPGHDQTIALDGEKHLLPKKMSIAMNTVGVHRNPKYWPTKATKTEGQGQEHDLNDFLPERWFRPSLSKVPEGQDDDEADEFGGFKERDTSEQMYRPVRGSYIPFSDGARSCIGRRIAQVEMIAALAVLFQKYSIELAVDEWASDEEVAGMGAEERRQLYEKARAKSRETIRQATSLLTLKLHGKQMVPVRLVRRGEERFLNVVSV
ncbi:Cytochrome P450 3A1 [Cytospora mali]|uniref:Cytochrome P450 3A1 n=1 Tax=Cytospora mali TaxID=578113 RepID=A0A194W9P7_CYTMA|nr:Cytochrome P450 3A1 [Valsa mali]